MALRDQCGLRRATTMAMRAPHHEGARRQPLTLHACSKLLHSLRMELHSVLLGQPSR